MKVNQRLGELKLRIIYLQWNDFVLFFEVDSLNFVETYVKKTIISVIFR
jgi:hypothetical protein